MRTAARAAAFGGNRRDSAESALFSVTGPACRSQTERSVDTV